MPKFGALKPWAWVQSAVSSRRYEAARTGDGQDATELLTAPTHGSISSASRVFDEEPGATDGSTVSLPFLGQMSPEDPRNSQDSDEKPHNGRPTWIKGVYLCANMTVCLLILNILLISVAGGLASKLASSGGSETSKVFYEGSYDVTERWSIGIHLFINISSTCILGASNYCMQTVLAPSRDDIDQYHAKRRWLDIGASSFRNLLAIPPKRLAILIILGSTATPFHLLYNSIIFTSSSYNDFWAFIAPSDFDPKHAQNLTTPALENCFGQEVFPSQYDKDTKESLKWDKLVQVAAEESSESVPLQHCLDFIDSAENRGSYQTGYKGLIILSDNLTIKDGGEASMLWIASSPSSKSMYGLPFVNLDSSTNSSEACSLDVDPAPRILYRSLQASECLGFKGKESCQLLLSPPIAIIISLVTFAKIIAMFLAAHLQKSRAPPIITTGDAVASFLERPDDTTKNMCWASLAHIKKGDWVSSPTNIEEQPPPTMYKRLSPAKQWRKAASPWRWFFVSVIFVIGVAFGIEFGPFTTFSSKTLEQLWDSQQNQRTSAVEDRSTISELTGVVTANSPQIIVTLGYYFFNLVLTNMLAATEYSSYGATRKGLRVTWPTKDSKQRSTYWLSIPYRYGIPVMLGFTIIHWLVSQGFYYMLLIPYGTDDEPIYEKKISSVASTGLPLFIAGLMGLVLGISLLILAFRRLRSSIPLAGTCSAAIGAACHPQEGAGNTTAGLREVMWGEIDSPLDGHSDEIDETEEQKGHCSFTSHDVRTPSLEKLYA